jgi:hypothetical protein
VGKHYSFTHSKPDPKSFALAFVNGVRHTVSFTDGDVRISRFQPRCNAVDRCKARSGEFTCGIPKSS